MSSPSPTPDRTHEQDSWKPRPRFPIRAILLLTTIVALACSIMLVIARMRDAELEEALRAREAAKRNYYQENSPLAEYPIRPS